MQLFFSHLIHFRRERKVTANGMPCAHSSQIFGGPMPEVITGFQTAIVSPRGDEYYVQVLAEQLASGLWEAWLEFVPVDDALDALLTKTETTQPTRDDVVHWAEILSETYLKGAFGRAMTVNEGRRRVRDYPTTTVTEDVVPFDPFDVWSLGTSALRVRLRALTRPELIAMIQNYDLNPGAKSLTRLSDAQLVTFIVTAVEVQVLQGKH
jgi:hypothetical protein